MNRQELIDAICMNTYGCAFDGLPVSDQRLLDVLFDRCPDNALELWAEGVYV